MTTVTYSHLEQTIPIIVNDQTVNAVPMDSVEVYQESGHLDVAMAGKQFAGALIAFKLPVPAIPNTQLAYSGLDFEFYVDDDSLGLLRCIEADLKIVWTPSAGTAIPNCMDGSSQLNLSEGGMWQIDNSVPAWTDTGFKPGAPPANQWVPVSMRHFLDFANNKFSYLSISDNGTEFQIPAALQGLPLLATNWESVLAPQFQLVLETAGAVIMRLRNITLTLSDTQF